MNHKGTIRIETGRLILRPFTMGDCEAAFRNWESDEKTTEFLRWQPMKTMEETAQVMQEWVDSYQDPSFYQWAIVPKDGGDVVAKTRLATEELYKLKKRRRTSAKV